MREKRTGVAGAPSKFGTVFTPDDDSGTYVIRSLKHKRTPLLIARELRAAMTKRTGDNHPNVRCTIDGFFDARAKTVKVMAFEVEGA